MDYHHPTLCDGVNHIPGVKLATDELFVGRPEKVGSLWGTRMRTVAFEGPERHRRPQAERARFLMHHLAGILWIPILDWQCGFERSLNR